MRLIDADALKETMRGEFIDHIEEYRAITIVNDAPTIEAVPKDFHDKTCEAMAKRHTEEIQRLMPKRGKWVDCKGGWKCTACDKWASFTSDFCPNCGADMREREGE